MAIKRKFKVLNKIFIFVIIAIAISGYLDSREAEAVQETKEWEAYNQYLSPIFFNISWMRLLIIIAGIYWLFTKDIIGGLALFTVPVVLMKAGLEDLAFHVFRGEIPNAMPWLGAYQNTFSKYVLQEPVVSSLGLILNIAVTTLLLYFVFKWLKSKGW